MKNISRIFIASSLFCACVGGPKSSGNLSSAGLRPNWVEGESPRWPRTRFVLGVASGDDESSAADRARGEISRVFSSAVSVDSAITESEAHQTQEGRTSDSFSQVVDLKIRTASAKMLEGVEVVERWKDSSAARYYALAVLNKSRAMSAVAEKTLALDTEASQWKIKLDTVNDKFERARAGAKLAILLKGRHELENDRRVLGGSLLPATIDAAAALSAAAKALADLDVIVIAAGDHAEDLQTGIISGLVTAGLMAKRGTPLDKGDIRVEAHSDAGAIESADERWKWSRVVATITLKDIRQEKTFARFDISERQASADAGEASRRAAAGLAKKAAEKTAAAISAFFAQ